MNENRAKVYLLIVGPMFATLRCGIISGVHRLAANRETEVNHYSSLQNSNKPTYYMPKYSYRQHLCAKIAHLVIKYQFIQTYVVATAGKFKIAANHVQSLHLIFVRNF